jgi:hypothetical protein
MRIRIHWVYFFLAFAVGLLCCQMLAPTPQIVYKFPSPYNAGIITYHGDERDSCFKYDAEMVECPRDKTLIRKQPHSPE